MKKGIKKKIAVIALTYKNEFFKKQKFEQLSQKSLTE